MHSVTDGRTDGRMPSDGQTTLLYQEPIILHAAQLVNKKYIL